MPTGLRRLTHFFLSFNIVSIINYQWVVRYWFGFFDRNNISRSLKFACGYLDIVSYGFDPLSVDSSCSHGSTYRWEGRKEGMSKWTQKNRRLRKDVLDSVFVYRHETQKWTGSHDSASSFKKKDQYKRILSVFWFSFCVIYLEWWSVGALRSQFLLRVTFVPNFPGPVWWRGMFLFLPLFI